MLFVVLMKSYANLHVAVVFSFF